MRMKMKQLLNYLLFVMLGLSVASCQKDNIVLIDPIETDDSEDLIANTVFTQTVGVAFSANGDAVITNTNDDFTVAVNGNDVTIVYSGEEYVMYELSGTTNDGFFKLYSAKKQGITLNDVSITNPNGAAVNNQCGKSLYLVVNEGTVNTLRDGENYTMVENEDQKGAVFSEGQILVSGKGTLNIYSVGRNCMASDDYIFVRPGCQLYLNSTSGHGIKAKDYVHIKGGVLNMEIATDGGKGINCDSLVYITGGRTTIIHTGTSRPEVDSLGYETLTGAAGIKADRFMTMSGGTLNIKCTGNDAKGLNVAEPFTFSGGELNVVCTGEQTTVAPKGVKCDTDCTIRGGKFYSCAPHGKALDVDGNLTIADGATTLNNDDVRIVEIIY